LLMAAASACIWSSFHHLCVVYRRGVLYTKPDTVCTQCTHMGWRKPTTNEKYALPASVFNHCLGRHCRWSSSGPHVLPAHLTGNDYLQFLREELPVMLEDVPLTVRQKMLFQHDGAPAHCSLRDRQFLTESYPQWRIGRGGPVAWPSRSPDLNPLDLFLWEYLKCLVYETEVHSIHELLQLVYDACHTVRTQQGIFERVCHLSGDEQKHVCRWLEITLNTYCKCLGTNKWLVTLLLLYFIFTLFWYC
jgi:hypothetical protein